MNMSTILNNCKRTTKIAANLLNSTNFSRKYATTVADYKITWTRPEKVSNLLPGKSGDKGIDTNVKPSDFCYMYDESPEMKDASDIVKRMFTLQFLPRKKTVNLRREKIFELVKGHKTDRNSWEARIASITNEIHQLQECIKENHRNSKVRVFLKEMIDKRRKYLAKLRKEDYRRFEWVLEKLNLVYMPFPEPPIQITRKESLTRLTEQHCNKIIQGKLDAYKAELKELQKDFYIEKAKKLRFIREEELACGLQPSVSEEDIMHIEQKVKESQI